MAGMAAMRLSLGGGTLLRAAFIAERGGGLRTMMATAVRCAHKKPASVDKYAAMGFAFAGLAAAGASVGVAEALSTQPEVVTLYQYAVCPFCNKVRATLDYYNVPYTVVEVNPLLKTEIKWSKDYKKVPIVTFDGSPVNNSYDIMRHIKEVYGSDKRKSGLFGGAGKKGEGEEEQWLKWVDDKFVHYLSPNIYRTTGEAFQAFDYITQEGNFGYFERQMARFAGAGAMYALTHGKLKKKYNIVNEREELYEKVDEWVEAVGKRKFLGGNNPNLADLAVFGVLRAIQGMDTFTDVMANTKAQPWYARMAAEVGEASRIDSPKK